MTASLVDLVRQLASLPTSELEAAYATLTSDPAIIHELLAIAHSSVDEGTRSMSLILLKQYFERCQEALNNRQNIPDCSGAGPILLDLLLKCRGRPLARTVCMAIVALHGVLVQVGVWPEMETVAKDLLLSDPGIGLLLVSWVGEALADDAQARLLPVLFDVARAALMGDDGELRGIAAESVYEMAFYDEGSGLASLGEAIRVAAQRAISSGDLAQVAAVFGCVDLLLGEARVDVQQAGEWTAAILGLVADEGLPLDLRRAAHSGIDSAPQGFPSVFQEQEALEKALIITFGLALSCAGADLSSTDVTFNATFLGNLAEVAPAEIVDFMEQWLGIADPARVLVVVEALGCVCEAAADALAGTDFVQRVFVAALQCGPSVAAAGNRMLHAVAGTAARAVSANAHDLVRLLMSFSEAGFFLELVPTIAQLLAAAPEPFSDLEGALRVLLRFAGADSLDAAAALLRPFKGRIDEEVVRAASPVLVAAAADNDSAESAYALAAQFCRLAPVALAPAVPSMLEQISGLLTEGSGEFLRLVFEQFPEEAASLRDRVAQAVIRTVEESDPEDELRRGVALLLIPFVARDQVGLLVKAVEEGTRPEQVTAAGALAELADMQPGYGARLLLAAVSGVEADVATAFIEASVAWPADGEYINAAYGLLRGLLEVPLSMPCTQNESAEDLAELFQAALNLLVHLNESAIDVSALSGDCSQALHDPLRMELALFGLAFSARSEQDFAHVLEAAQQIATLATRPWRPVPMRAALRVVRSIAPRFGPPGAAYARVQPVVGVAFRYPGTEAFDAAMAIAIDAGWDSVDLSRVLPAVEGENDFGESATFGDFIIGAAGASVPLSVRERIANRIFVLPDCLWRRVAETVRRNVLPFVTAVTHAALERLAVTRALP